MLTSHRHRENYKDQDKMSHSTSSSTEAHKSESSDYIWDNRSGTFHHSQFRKQSDIVTNNRCNSTIFRIVERDPHNTDRRPG